ncbi:NtaA/DmoA family FMN-dependent monooxygenase [Modestobacter excelsi]|uniref:NtaA/DmoA family FMN-dependent monooxygenase n=1 Tax=Modestobacter excelsi TaxID=2213161 RepID=UPI001C20E796
MAHAACRRRLLHRHRCGGPTGTDRREGGLQFVFLPDRLFLHGDLAFAPPVFVMDPVVTLSALAQATERIGLVGTVSTSFTEPYVLARQLKALDVISHGRAGWNAVPSYEPDAFANFGRPLPPREKKYERLHEVLHIVQALWGSWGEGAGRPDKAGAFADPAQVRPIDLQGRHVAARGPLPVPPSEQGQPVVVMPASSGYGLQAAGMYADVVIGMPMTVEEGRAQRDVVRHPADASGRDPDEVTFIAFTGYALGGSTREALDRRRALDDRADPRQALARLGALLGLGQHFARPDEALSPSELALASAHPGCARSAQALQLARAGWSPRDILAHGVLDPHPSVTGTAEQAADHLQEWFQAGAVDGFMLSVDDFHDGIDDVVDQVVPILRERGLFPNGYVGTTLRDHLGLPRRYGLDPRVMSSPA